jgi:hypothetical protein
LGNEESVQGHRHGVGVGRAGAVWLPPARAEQA